MTILGFCGQTRLQLRLQGIARIYSPDSAVANHAWQALPSWTRQTYTGGPPGDEHADATLAETDALQGTHDTKGKMHFGVIHFKTRTLDWFQLRRRHNLRARLSYDASGILVDVRWVNP
ncbi:hypothetical protein DFO67_109154 [Modicisalibacter xianhensis]|uniref:Uncharacterized protein n=1 Tax=Modicisalibacter xianhensis TaxID=442341 RepID=A0A4R8FR12_9GAMM|nr:hypothetical protein DFO67_109154 [Halomonas xianhensis]